MNEVGIGLGGLTAEQLHTLLGEAFEGKKVLIVTHGQVIDALAGYVL